MFYDIVTFSFQRFHGLTPSGTSLLPALA